jgi:ribosomal 30S subunit maturation factor RimM
LPRNRGSNVHQLESSKPHKRQFLIKLRGVDSINAAQPLIGSTLLISDDALDPLEPGNTITTRSSALPWLI